MSTSAKLLTAEDLAALPEDRGHFELIEGELQPMMSPSGAAHGVVAATVIRMLQTHANARRLGIVMSSEVGFLLSRNPDTVLAPDVSFVRRERLPKGVPESFFEGAPDLAVEVVSPSDRLKELRAKARRFVEFGTRLVWIVNPRRRNVEVISTDDPGRVLEARETLTAGDVVPGFQCSVSEFFADLEFPDA